MDTSADEVVIRRFSPLTVNVIRGVLRQANVQVGRAQCALSKSRLLAFAVGQGPLVIKKLQDALDKKNEEYFSTRRSLQVLRTNGISISHGKRKRDDVITIGEQQSLAVQEDLHLQSTGHDQWSDRPKRCRRESAEAMSEGEKRIDSVGVPGQPLVTGCHTLEEEHSEQFMKIPSAEELQSIQEAFLSRTSQAALEEGVCAVCAREIPRQDLSWHILEDIPHVQLLTPPIPHRAHELCGQALLEPRGCEKQGSRTMIAVCFRCFGALKRNQRPRFGLCNGLWIGAVLAELQDLSIPEQLLIALTFPRCFVFKLHPRVGQMSDPASLQRGMVGNVTSFPLNGPEIIKMIEGRLLPQHLAILPALIAVTFVGAKQFPRNWLKGVLRVRRGKVAVALMWLIANNLLYRKFTLDSERLEKLPMDDVPVEILAAVQLESDASVLVQEAESYVPGDFQAGGDPDGVQDCSDLVLEALDTDPEQGSVQVVHLGTADSALEIQTDGNAMSCAVANLVQEGTYEIKPGNQFANDFPDRGAHADPAANYCASAFPTLFPYGVGGVESQRSIGFLEHVRHCLLLHDRRFRTHHSFPFVMFGILQKRQALSSARIQVCRRDFDRFSQDILKVRREDLKAAANEKEKGLPISNERVKKLLNSAKLTSGRIVGTDESRAALRSKIWSTVIFMGPPSIWMTINLADVHDPIAQLFCGEEINLDEFNDMQGRCANNIFRAQNIAKDPYAAAKYFHVMIRIILEVLFGIRATSRMTYSQPGLLGRVAAYTGAVESQNCQVFKADA